MKKRIVSFVLAALLIWTLLPTSVFAADIVASGTCGDNLTWTLDSEGTLTISGTGSMTDYTNKSIVPWYSRLGFIKSAIIESGVTSIGAYAFEGCSSLASVTIPDSVTTIGDWAFSNCSSLASVTIPDSVTSIGHGAFSGCSSLASVTIPNSVTSIGSGAFYGCSSLASVTIPNSVTSVGDHAFTFCSSLASVTIGNSVTSIGDSAFYDCTGLTEINYNAKAVTDLTSSSYVFDNAGTAGSGIKVTFGDGVEKIPAYLFCDCDGLTSVTIPNSVTTIGDSAFCFCSNLTSVTIPDRVTSIGDSAFCGCDGLTKVTIPDRVTSIGDSAFQNCSSLTNVTIGNSVTSIGDHAFQNCSSLTNVTIGNSVTSIGDHAFYNCTGLTEINYNAKAVTDLTSSSNVFDNAGTAGSGIKVTFGEKVKKVPDYLFSTQSYSYIPKIVFLGNAPAIGSKSFNRVTTSAYYPYGNDTWTSEVMKGYGGHITWIPYSDAEATSVVCNGKTSYIVGEELYTSSISVTIERSDGCIEKYKYASGEITLGEYDMSKSGKQSITVTCKDVTTHLNIYVHGLTSETMPANDYPESSHNYEDNQDKTYTYTADGAYSLDVTFSNETETEANIDYIYVNGTRYTGKELANKTVHINGDTLTVRLVSDGSDGAYGFSIDSIIATYLVHEYTDTVVAPTCTEKGYTTHTCVCGDNYADSYVEALGHDLVHHDGKAATCTEKGWEAYDACSRCDHTTYKEISALGHNYKNGVCTRCGAKDPDYKPPVKENPFVDVSESSVYYDAILWAYYHEPQQITGGYTATEFRPGNPCTRGQVVTFLWRAAGCPEPTGDTSMFKDASSIAAPYQKAVAWAVEKGITTGFADGTFRPNDSVTRAQFVTFLWRYEGKPATSGSIAGFTDAASISGPYQQAVAWAVEKGITTGYNDDTFRPNATCTRWAVVLFMYRDMT